MSFKVTDKKPKGRKNAIHPKKNTVLKQFLNVQNMRIKELFFLIKNHYEIPVTMGTLSRIANGQLVNYNISTLIRISSVTGLSPNLLVTNPYSKDGFWPAQLPICICIKDYIANFTKYKPYVIIDRAGNDLFLKDDFDNEIFAKKDWFFQPLTSFDEIDSVPE